MVGRPYDEERDLAAVTRMWREVGWIDDSDGQAAGLKTFLSMSKGLVADVHGEAECLVHRSVGTVHHTGTDLPLCAISAVTTSHVGRRQGLASALMAEALAEAVEEGAAVATLGFFEQGYYDRFGFGTGPYQHRLSFDPASLQVPVPDRPPVRLGAEHMREVHALLARRPRGHGSVVLDPPQWLEPEWSWLENPFGLGFRADDGRLTHALIGSAKDEHGPYVIDVLAHEEPHQVLELLGLVKALGDQVNLVVVTEEPAGIQLQDLIREPARQRRVARLAGGSGALHVTMASQQDRILDLGACIAAVEVATPVAFGLRLRDPIGRFGTWGGIGGEHTVRLGPTSSAEPGLDPDLPVLDASVGAFTRLWWGVRPASSLALTDDLHGPTDLLADLDAALRLPTPQAGWIY
ncbi:GNAT family N-acetyltransferase [Acidimicrobiia bacterium EGI L10123]|uniref:GNAT family N-acetyltransferase n=1 Tax=Salinilacustrithrix flava TaxID=2957203 RepID=UPI003D7C1C66|nr:GNAT family N-acetyltransferase [Acidimicrobiia bacterium EGI L10123]